MIHSSRDAKIDVTHATPLYHPLRVLTTTALMYSTMYVVRFEQSPWLLPPGSFITMDTMKGPKVKKWDIILGGAILDEVH